MVLPIWLEYALEKIIKQFFQRMHSCVYHILLVQYKILVLRFWVEITVSYSNRYTENVYMER